MYSRGKPVKWKHVGWSGGINYTQSLCSYWFDGVNNYISTPDTLSSFISGASPLFAMRFIIKRRQNAPQGIFSNRISGDFQILYRIETGNKLRLYFSPDGTNEWRVETTNALSNSVDFYDIIVTFDSSQTGIDIANVYINGVKETMVYVSGTYSTTLNNSASSLLFGQQGVNVGFFKGYYNQISIMDYIPSDALILSAYNSGSPIISSQIFNPSNVQLEYIFDNDAWNGTEFDVIDDSGNSNDGLTVGMDAVDKDCNENPYT